MTVAYLNKPSTPTDVAVNFIDQSDLELRQSSYDPKTGTYSSEFVLNDGDATRNTTVSALTRVNKDGSAFYSIKLRTVRTVTVSSVVTEEAPADFNISWSLPSIQDDASSVAVMLGAVYGLTMDGVTTKVPNTGIIGLMTRALVAQLF